MSLLNAHAPNIHEAMDAVNIDILWHPSFSTVTPADHRALLKDIMSGKRDLDILCVEGAVVNGPANTGMFDTFEGRPKRDIISALAE